MAQSKEFQNYDQFSLQHCFKKALELEGTYQVSEGVNMVRPTDVLHMYHDEDDDEICEINQIGGDNKARNNACWKCGEVGHFQGVKILFNPILSCFFGKILFCPIFWGNVLFHPIFWPFCL